MEDSSEDEREMLPKVWKKSFVPYEPTTMSELASVRNSRQKLPIQFNEHEQPVGATSKKMQLHWCMRLTTDSYHIQLLERSFEWAER